MFSFFDAASQAAATEQFNVGERIDFPMSKGAMLVASSGDSFEYNPKKDLDSVDEPGVYRFQTEKQSSPFAVNLNPSESRTEPLDEESLAGFGVLLGENVSTVEALENERQLRDRELESKQRLWQWMLVAALALLGLETLLGAIWSRRGKAVEVVMTETG